MSMEDTYYIALGLISMGFHSAFGVANRIPPPLRLREMPMQITLSVLELLKLLAIPRH